MYFKDTQTAQAPLWEGRLIPIPDTTTEKSITPKRQTKGGKQLTSASLPIVSIGVPDVWKLQDLYSNTQIPKNISVKLKGSDYYFIRLACSFRPQYKEIAIENAKFCLFFQPTNGEIPIAYDMHPILIENEVKKNVKVSLNPTLKFFQIEADIGKIDFGFEYNELIPSISATGLMETNPAWEYQEAPGYSIQGSKLMHILLRAPKGQHPIMASASLDAKLRANGSLLNAVFGLEATKAQAHLEMLFVE